MSKRIILVLATALISTNALLESFYITINQNCTNDEFTCRNKRCIPKSKRCDNSNDCQDNSDEMDCDAILCKEPRYFKCHNERCISTVFRCDGENDCEDYSDELNCEHPKLFIPIDTNCSHLEWQCSNKQCIPIEWVCNGENDCMDGSDETKGCTKSVKRCDQFKCKNGHCVPKEWRCDGSDDCFDNSDEVDCDKIINTSTACTLDNRRFFCTDNSSCLHLNQVCDGKPHCSDGSDESNTCNASGNSCKTHECAHECVQLPNGPHCLCPSGYHRLDDRTCRDINECEFYGNCDQHCANAPGIFTCSCVNGYRLQSDNRTCKAINGEAVMVFSSKTEIRTFFLRSQLYYSVAKNLKQVVGVSFDGDHIYWTDIFSEHESIVRSLPDGGKRQLLVTAGLGAPEDLAVDFVTQNIYFTDAERKHIGVCTSDGKHCTVLVNRDIHKPRGIALDPDDGYMYWTDWGKIPEIARSNMDGTEDVSLVVTDIHWPNGLAIDRPNRRLYWTDAKRMSLESISLDGTDRRTVLSGIVHHPYAIAVFENRLYWSDWTTHSIQVCDKFTGKHHQTIVKEQGEYIYGLSIYHPSMKPNRENPCQKAYCSDICLLRGKGYSCACPQNKLLSYDGHTCREMERRQMLIAGGQDMILQVEHQLLGRHDVNLLPLYVKSLGAMAYSGINQTLFASDLMSKKIIRFNFNSQRTDILPIDDLGEILSMDYDYFGNNLYFCDKTKSTLEVFSLTKMKKTVLLHDMLDEVPQALVLVPEEGTMFVAFKRQYTQETHIDRFHMDGTNRVHTLENGIVGPVSFVYDSTVHRIFFADAGTGNIEYISLQGENRHGFRSLRTEPVSLTVLKNDLFWVNKNSKRIYWTEKNSSVVYNKKITIDIPKEIERFQLVSATPKTIPEHPCHLNNGNCSHLCLAVLKHFICACPQGMSLLHDNRTCSDTIRCGPHQFRCHWSNRCVGVDARCNGQSDCPFGEDEAGCGKGLCPADQYRCDNGNCIARNLTCNGHYDCTDRSDEKRCHGKIRSCAKEHFRCNDNTCISERFLCDGVKDCSDGEDEKNCLSATCNESQFRCLSGTCIPKSWECDQEYDCTDLSDEHPKCIKCSSNMMQCKNGRCIDRNLRCDGSDDCGDGTDERFCDELTSITACHPTEFACLSQPGLCVPLTARCNRTYECPHREDEQDCTHCNIDEYECTNGRCVSREWLCDGVDDCGDRSDEEQKACQPAAKSNVTQLTHCDSENFRCANGVCIEMRNACDGRDDCGDGSDEGGNCDSACAPTDNPCTHTCLRTPAGAVCRCRWGYEGDGKQCADVDECKRQPPVCPQTCTNLPGEYKCDCFNNFALRTDKHSCKAMGESMRLIYNSNDQLRQLSLKENSLKVLFTQNGPKISGLDATVDLDYIYFAIENLGTIYRLNPRNNENDYIENVGRPQLLAVDWSTNNIYYVDVSHISKSINVCHFDQKFCGKLLDVQTRPQVTALTVDAVHRALFYALSTWKMFEPSTYSIYRTDLDGSHNLEILKSVNGFLTGITYDHNKRLLYFVDHFKGEIGRSSYEGLGRMVIKTNLTRPNGLTFFEDHLYFLTENGHMEKCRLWENVQCDYFKLQGYAIELFTIIQQSKQPLVHNVCDKHNCTFICLTGGINNDAFRCLCKNGKVVNGNVGCDDNNVNNIARLGMALYASPDDRDNAGSVLAGILIPIALVTVAASIYYYYFKKRHSGSFNISMRFYNPSYDLHKNETDKSILKPGQHEYTNPLEYNIQEDNVDLVMDNNLSSKPLINV